MPSETYGDDGERDLPYIEPSRLDGMDADELEVGDRFRLRVYQRELIVKVETERQLDTDT